MLADPHTPLVQQFNRALLDGRQEHRRMFGEFTHEFIEEFLA
jgi:hypothetical protein